MADLETSDIVSILDAAERERLPRVLEGKGAALIFEHPSARTRNAAEMAVFRLGGHPISIRGDEIGIDRRESAEDIALTLASYHSVIGARVTDHQTLVRMAEALEGAGSRVPVINLLSNVEHPSQALADLLTIRQHFGELKGRKVAFIGDANNVALSLAIGCALVGASFSLAAPKGFWFGEVALGTLRSSGGEFIQTEDVISVASGADVLYSDVWVSMGEEEEGASKRAAFSGFSIDDSLLEHAREDAIVMHCLPAHRGEEVSASVIDGPRSMIWLQARNRMFSLIGLISVLLEEDGSS